MLFIRSFKASKLRPDRSACRGPATRGGIAGRGFDFNQYCPHPYSPRQPGSSTSSNEDFLVRGLIRLMAIVNVPSTLVCRRTLGVSLHFAIQPMIFIVIQMSATLHQLPREPKRLSVRQHDRYVCMQGRSAYRGVTVALDMHNQRHVPAMALSGQTTLSECHACALLRAAQGHISQHPHHERCRCLADKGAAGPR